MPSFCHGLLLLGLLGEGPPSGTPPLPRTIVVELFTSEGCSSCPPADELLIRLAREFQAGVHIIPLSFHVDYWNGLGWVDPYASGTFTERQRDYNRALGDRSSYTPQMVVGGVRGFVGSSEREARDAIASTTPAPLPVSIRRTPEGIHVEGPAGPGDADVLLAVTEGGLTTRVLRGENAGRTLHHTAVVRSLQTLGHLNPAGPFSQDRPLPLTKGWQLGRLSAVVLIQARGSRRILGAAELKL